MLRAKTHRVHAAASRDVHLNLPFSLSQSVPFLCWDISHLSKRAQFVLLSCAIFAFYLVYGYVQEWIFRQEGMKPHG